jgi:hypothetical protein
VGDQLVEPDLLQEVGGRKDRTVNGTFARDGRVTAVR